MDIQSVKIQGDGYLVNGSMSVPKSEGNRHYQLVKEWLGFNAPAPEFTVTELTKQAEQAAKADRTEAVANITVSTFSGKTFDGDEKSQGRMARAIVASEPLEETVWVLADNTPAIVTREELQEALKFAGAKQTSLWVV